MSNPEPSRPFPVQDPPPPLDRLRDEQDWRGAMLGGTGAAVVCAFAWAAITYVTDSQLGIMAIAVGAIVGLAVRHFGKGLDTRYGVLGAVLAIASILAGNVLAVIAFASRELNQSFLTALASFDWAAAPTILRSFMGPIDFLFYGIAIYEGYRFAFREVGAQAAAPDEGVAA